MTWTRVLPRGLQHHLQARRDNKVPKLKARHVIPSAILSIDDDPAKPSAFLFDAALSAVEAARHVDLSAIAARDDGIGRFVDVWPGEHYKLLAGFVRTLKPASIVEIGTATGASALALAQDLPPGGSLTTFDVVPYREIAGTILRDTDRQIRPLTADLSDRGVFEQHRGLIEDAALIFADGPKDGVTEPRLLQLLSTVRFRRRCLVVLDDIRVPNMLRCWRAVAQPKLDLTSFGHWSGTGLIEFAPSGS